LFGVGLVFSIGNVTACFGVTATLCCEIRLCCPRVPETKAVLGGVAGGRQPGCSQAMGREMPPARAWAVKYYVTRRDGSRYEELSPLRC